MKGNTSRTAARKAGAAAVGRLFHGPICPRVLNTLSAESGVSTQAPLSVGPVFDIAVPSGATAPCCLCCGAPITWEKLAKAGTRLPLARGGFYACCDTCDSKNRAGLVDR
jgi:hypothetical protein